MCVFISVCVWGVNVSVIYINLVFGFELCAMYAICCMSLGFLVGFGINCYVDACMCV